MLPLVIRGNTTFQRRRTYGRGERICGRGTHQFNGADNVRTVVGLIILDLLQQRRTRASGRQTGGVMLLLSRPLRLLMSPLTRTVFTSIVVVVVVVNVVSVISKDNVIFEGIFRFVGASVVLCFRSALTKRTAHGVRAQRAAAVVTRLLFARDFLVVIVTAAICSTRHRMIFRSRAALFFGRKRICGVASAWRQTRRLVVSSAWPRFSIVNGATCIFVLAQIRGHDAHEVEFVEFETQIDGVLHSTSQAARTITHSTAYQTLPRLSALDVNLTNAVTIPETIATKSFSTASVLTRHNTVDTLFQLTLMTPLLSLLLLVTFDHVKSNGADRILCRLRKF